MELYVIILIVWLHFVADFIFQSDRIAINKSKSNLVLLEHVVKYCILFLIIGTWFAVLNAALHFIVDWCTSRITSYYWSKDKRHEFFVTIGCDQALHLTCLTTTYYWMKHYGLGVWF